MITVSRVRGATVLLATVVLLLVGLAPSAQADAIGSRCGQSTYFTDITVERWANGDFKIIATPNDLARVTPDPEAATLDEWHAIQDCVSGLYGALADSIWQQLSCHQHFALVPGAGGWATGPTYDLESWRGQISNWVLDRCGNALNTTGDHSEPPVSSGRPDAGWTDLYYGSIG